MDPRLVWLVLVLFFLLITPEPQSYRSFHRASAEEVEIRSQHLLDVVNSSSYGDLRANGDQWMNLTGFRSDDDFQWQLLPVAKDLSRKQIEVPNGWLGQGPPVYHRPAGELTGNFARVKSGKEGNRINLTVLSPDAAYLSKDFLRNVTELDGEITLNLLPWKWDAYRDVHEIKATGSLTTPSSPSTGWDVIADGVHFLQTGSIILTTRSEKYDGNWGLPQFVLDEQDFAGSKNVTLEKMAKYLEKYKQGDSAGPTTLIPAPSCELIIWLQQRPLDMGSSPNQTRQVIDQIEAELANPTGAPIGQPPNIEYSAVVFSPDCGYILQAQLTGPKREVFWSLASRLVIALIVTVCLQIALLKRQMEEASTDSTRSRIAYQSIAIMAMGDGLLFAGLIGFLIIDKAIILLIAAAAFVNCLNVAFLEVKFLLDLWTVQVGDPAQRERDRQPRPVVSTSADGSTELPLPVTSSRAIDSGASPIILPPDQNIEAAIAEDEQMATQDGGEPRALSFQALYVRFYFVIVLLIFMSVWATTWPRALRSAYMNTLSFLYLSFWIPQIYRNVVRNCRKALSWEYVIGISALRVGLVVYWYLDDHNILSIDINPTSAGILLGWLWLQVAVLASQQHLGPRFLVKDSWCPPAYDYHPILRDDDLETASMLPIGFVASASEAKTKDGKDDNRKIFDCAICMNEIDVPVVAKADGGGATWLAQRNYMVTPCRHIFHSECLEGWMNLRLVCPICREGLPPL